ncbi:unnamed protein product [Tetraodon nigroviridis]|uniref:(spotted green pufferfish) hypothetical protein n=1 Tax=Tetraodon nigroviridis TaxID=99883 RepID=Q4S7I7_TETNG|nr:unnamed protein product [Tetraodon nigroviridis]
MGDGDLSSRLGNTKALLGILAGAGASYGIYKLVSGGSLKKSQKSVTSEGPGGRQAHPAALLAKVSGLDVVCPPPEAASGDIIHASSGNLEPQHLKVLLSRLQSSGDPAESQRILLTLGNAAAFTVNQNLIRDYEGIGTIAAFLSDPAPEVRVQTLNALNNLSMNIRNQDQIKVCVPQVLELIEVSPVNSELQLAALRLLTNLSVTDQHQHLFKTSFRLLLSLLVVGNEELQAPASVLLLFDAQTASPVLLRLLTFAGNLRPGGPPPRWPTC